MTMDRKKLAKLLGGERNNGWVNFAGPGHSVSDRSLGIFIDPSAPDGFWVNSFADDPEDCRAYVKELLQKISGNGSICLSFDDQAAPHKKAEAHAGALAIWQEAQPIAATLACTYLAVRKCAPLASHSCPSDLRFHPTCPFAGQTAPALVALTRDAVTAEPRGIHRTALSDNGFSKRQMPDGLKPKMILGSALGAAVQLHSAGTCLGIAEGVETALSARKIFNVPTWAAMSAPGVRSFPLIQGISRLVVFADNDDAGLSAARACGLRYSRAGIDVEIRYPPVPGSDWNDFLQMEYSNGTEIQLC
jgi:putative DNA primase/helicase